MILRRRYKIYQTAAKPIRKAAFKLAVKIQDIIITIDIIGDINHSSVESFANALISNAAAIG